MSMSSDTSLLNKGYIVPTYANIQNACNDFCEKTPTATLIYLGTSLLGRSIPAVSVGKGQKSYIYVAAHHASEWITATLLLRFMSELSFQLSKERLFKIDSEYYLTHRRIIIIPALNVDGVEIALNGLSKSCIMHERLISMNKSDNFSTWKANARGVDLNHNYNAGFEKYKIIEKSLKKDFPCSSGYSGEFPESEPECSSLCNLIRTVNAHSIITFHAQGEEIYCSSCGKMHASHKAYGEYLSKISTYTLSSPDEKASYGGLTDWFIQEYGRPAFTIECGKGITPLPINNCYEIYCKLRELLFRYPFIV